ncbi:DUF6019 family protein [Desulfitobacterium chlororespirans]|uniref:DUF6019 family protein n=1 Tax=Desulfitobacterium chlororespirans TaxID=51616 RepID=UPI00249DA360|nr:DUF6019 family protein [Desulfitobacterium chlororespirans]
MFDINAAIGLLITYVSIIILTFLVAYMIIKTAVRNGVREANRNAIEKQELQLQALTDLVSALVQDKYKKPGDQ